MNEHIDDLLPFYINATLPAQERDSIEAHLSTCLKCQVALREWEDLEWVIRSATPLSRPAGPAGSLSAEDLPALSPLVLANLRRKPSFPEAVLETAGLICAQRIYLTESWLLQTLCAVFLAGVLAGFFLPVKSTLLTAVAFFILVPLLAVLAIGFFERHAAGSGIAAAPTQPGVLIFARLALTLVVIAGLALLCSLLLSGLDDLSLGWLVVTWLGPLLWLPALATLLALLLDPWTAAGISVTLWGGIALLLVSEQYGRSLVGFSLAPLLYPSWSSFGVQVLLAGILWLTCWLWLFWGAPPKLRLERNS